MNIAILTYIGENMPQAGSWYKSKKGFLCRLETLYEDGSAVVVSHMTGKAIVIPKEQVECLTESNDPGTPVGLLMVKEGSPGVSQLDYDILYKKYSRIVPGSIYRLKSVDTEKPDPFIRRRKISIKGSTRCKIICSCGKERDIKVQDAFQVNHCKDCRNKKRRAKLQKMLDKKKKFNG